MPENRIQVVSLADGYSASIMGGVDAEWFQLSGDVIEFVYNPDYEMPFDNDRNNEYDLQIEITDGTLTQIQDAKVIVTDVAGDWISGTNAMISVSGVGFEDSSIDSSTSDITLVFTFPGRFTVESMTFDGSSDLDYSSATNNGWVAGTNEDGDSTLTQTFTYTDMVSATHEFVAEDDEYSTKWNPTVEMTEQIVVYDPSESTGADVVMRTTTEVVPIRITYQDSLETSTNVNVFIQQEGFIQAVHAVTLLVDDSTMDVELMLETIVNDPWTVTADSFTYTDDTNMVAANSMTIEEVGTRNCVDLKCTQTFKISFDSTSCEIDGELSITMSTTYSTANNDQSFAMQIARDDGCVVDLGAVSLSGVMNLYDSTFTTTATTFYLEETVYGIATLTSVATIESVTLSSLATFQDGMNVCKNCQADSDVNYQVIASEDVNVFKYSFYLNSQMFAGALEPEGKTTSISATFDVIYTDPGAAGRRKLEQIDVELRQSIIVQSEPCGKDVALGYVKKTNCKSNPDRQYIRQCTQDGWEVILYQCDETVAKTESSKSQGSTLYILSTGALVLLIAGIVWYNNQGTKIKEIGAPFDKEFGPNTVEKGLRSAESSV